MAYSKTMWLGDDYMAWNDRIIGGYRIAKGVGGGGIVLGFENVLLYVYKLQENFHWKTKDYP